MAENSTVFELDQANTESLTFEISDEMLENAAAQAFERVGSYTISFCSGLSTCPA